MRESNPAAIVTGGGRRLGMHIALSLAENGFDVAINYAHSKVGAYKTAKRIESLGRKSLVIQADISRKAQVHRMVKAVYNKFGRIDLLVNNSSVFVESKAAEISEKIWNDTININLKGPFLCIQAVTPYLLNQKNGSIINIASLGGIQAWGNHIPYSVSKAGLIMLTKCFAKELAPKVRVNAIAPGTIIMEGTEDPRIQHIPVNRIPLNRYGSPTDIAEAVVFLATKARYVTGELFVIDGGRSIQ